MPKALALQPHLPLDAWETRDRRAQDPGARGHWPTMWLLAPGRAAAPVAAVTGDRVNGVRTPGRPSSTAPQGPISLRLSSHAAGVPGGAGGHVRPQGQGPRGIPGHGLPPYAPARPPAARRWPFTNEAFAHRHFRAMDALQDSQAQRCLKRQGTPAVIRADPQLRWWPHTA